MAFIQQATPPPNKRLSFSLREFTGGLNNRSEQLQPNQATSIINMMFADETIMETRYGQKFFDEFDVGTALTFIDEYKPYNDADVLIRASNTNVYFGSTLVKTVSGRINGVNHEGKYFFVDGNKFYVYGIFPQATDTYTKVIGTASNLYKVMEIISPAIGHARLDASHVRGVLNIDYTNSKIWYEPCENEFVDAYNGANVVPNGIQFIVSHNGRLFMSGDEKDDDNIFITHSTNPYYFPVSMPLQLPPNSDKIVGLHVYDDAVIVGRRNDLYAITGKTNDPDLGFDVFQLRRINSHTGFANSDAVDVVNNYLFFMGNDGNAYSLASSRSDEKILATSILSQTIDVKKTPINLTLDDVRDAHSAFLGDEWHISIKDKVLVFSYRHRAWTMYNQINATVFYKYGDKLIWGRADGRTAEFDKEVFLDFGVPYESHWYSRQFDMNDANSNKQFREFYVVAHAYDEYLSDVNMIFEVDYVDVKDKFVVSNQISRWGVSKWGDRFINRNIIQSIPFVIGRRGRNIRFKLFNRWFVSRSTALYSDLEHLAQKFDGELVCVTSESAYYLYTKGEWIKQDATTLNQRMKVYQINGDYEMRGKR